MTNQNTLQHLEDVARRAAEAFAPNVAWNDDAVAWRNTFTPEVAVALLSRIRDAETALRQIADGNGLAHRGDPPAKAELCDWQMADIARSYFTTHAESGKTGAGVG